MEREKSKSNYLFGYYVDKKRFWLLFTLMLVFFTSPLSHLPFLVGYGIYACIFVGLLAVALNIAVPLILAHWSWRQKGMKNLPDDAEREMTG